MAGQHTIATRFQAATRRVSSEAVCLRVREGDVWRDITWEEAGRAVRELALGLLALGMGEGEVVLVVADGMPAATYVELAAMSARGLVSALPSASTPAAIAAAVDELGARTVFFGNAREAETFRDSGVDTVALRAVLVADPDFPASSGQPAYVTVEDLRTQGRGSALDEELGRRLAAASPGDAAALLYTRGTSQPRKLVGLSHANLLAAVEGLLPLVLVTEGDVFLNALPPCDPAARTAGTLLPLFRGAIVAYAAAGESALLDDIDHARPSCVVATARALGALYATLRDEACARHTVEALERAVRLVDEVEAARAVKHEPGWWLRYRCRRATNRVLTPIRRRLGEELKQLIVWGARVPPDAVHLFRAAGVPLCESYGLTEAGGLITLNPRDHGWPGTVGKPIEGAEIRASDDGELFVRGPSVATAYLPTGAAAEAAPGQEARAAIEALDDDGWLRPRDRGTLNQDGYLSLAGPSATVFEVDGGSVAPGPIEAALEASPFVHRAVVYPHGSPARVAALIAPDGHVLMRWSDAGGQPLEDLETAGDQPLVRELFQGLVAAVSKDLAPHERIETYRLAPEPWTAEDGQLTARGDVRRDIILAAPSDAP